MGEGLKGKGVKRGKRRGVFEAIQREKGGFWAGTQGRIRSKVGAKRVIFAPKKAFKASVLVFLCSCGQMSVKRRCKATEGRNRGRSQRSSKDVATEAKHMEQRLKG